MTEHPRRRRGRSRPGLTPRKTPTPKVSQTAQPKRLLHRHHRLRSSHPGSTPRMITTLRARVAVTMQPFVPRLLMILSVEVTHGDRDWLHQPGLNHADSKPLITRRFKAERNLKRIYFHHKRPQRRRLTVEPSSSLHSAIIGTRTELLTSHESTTPIPSRRSEGTPPWNPQDFSPTRGPMTIPRDETSGSVTIVIWEVTSMSPTRASLTCGYCEVTRLGGTGHTNQITFFNLEGSDDSNVDQLTPSARKGATPVDVHRLG